MATPWYHKLRDRRKELGFNVAQLARMAKVSRQTIMAYEANEVKYPRPDVVAKITYELEMDADLLWAEITHFMENGLEEPVSLHEETEEYIVGKDAARDTPPDRLRDMVEAFKRLPVDGQQELLKKARSMLPAIEDTGQ